MILRRSDPNGPGITRVRHGRGFGYLDTRGRRVEDTKVLDRIRGLAVPPAWERVWICPKPNGHIQAMGIDAAGRRQYVYHRKWRAQRDEEKFDRLLRLADRLPDARATITRCLESTGLNRDRVLCAALRMIDEGVFRTGGEEYARANETFGAATLQRRHVRVGKEHVEFGYRAKWGLRRSLRIRDRRLAAVLRSLVRGKRPRARVLSYRDDDGLHEVRAEELNSYLKEMIGEEFTVKDLRTWNATVHAAVVLADAGVPESAAAAKRSVRAALKEVSAHLGNTPAMARTSYVDPRVIELFERGVTIRPALDKLSSDGVRGAALRDAADRAVARMLRRA